MLTTIKMASCIWVQGELVAQLPDGDQIVRDGSKTYRGRPVRSRTEKTPPNAA